MSDGSTDWSETLRVRDAGEVLDRRECIATRTGHPDDLLARQRDLADRLALAIDLDDDLLAADRHGLDTDRDAVHTVVLRLGPLVRRIDHDDRRRCVAAGEELEVAFVVGDCLLAGDLVEHRGARDWLAGGGVGDLADDRSGFLSDGGRGVKHHAATSRE
jgi:hypothetical protein